MAEAKTGHRIIYQYLTKIKDKDNHHSNRFPMLKGCYLVQTNKKDYHFKSIDDEIDAFQHIKACTALKRYIEIQSKKMNETILSKKHSPESTLNQQVPAKKIDRSFFNPESTLREDQIDSVLNNHKLQLQTKKKQFKIKPTKRIHSIGHLGDSRFNYSPKRHITHHHQIILIPRKESVNSHFLFQSPAQPPNKSSGGLKPFASIYSPSKGQRVSQLLKNKSIPKQMRF